MCIKDIHTKGYVKLREAEGLALIGADNFKLLNTEERARDNGEQDVDPLLATKLDMFGQYLYNKYILPEWPKAVFMVLIKITKVGTLICLKNMMCFSYII